MYEKIDVLLSPYPIKDEEELEREVLFQEDFVLVVKKGHEPIISEEAFQTLIISRPLIEYNQDSSDRIQADRLLRSLGQKPGIAHFSVHKLFSRRIGISIGRMVVDSPIQSLGCRP